MIPIENIETELRTTYRQYKERYGEYSSEIFGHASELPNKYTPAGELYECEFIMESGYCLFF